MSRQETFLQLVRLGVGHGIGQISKEIVWNDIQALAEQQGLSAIVLDGLESLPNDVKPIKVELLQWIGAVLQSESINSIQLKSAAEMAELFHQNNIRTYVLKGMVVAECYPKPRHRFCVDLDCYLLPEKGESDAWSLGNDLINSKHYEVRFDYYKNSTFLLPGLTVENHLYMVPFRGNKKLMMLELMLRGFIREDKGEDKIEGTYLYRPPIMVSAIFLIEHAYSHFLHEGLTWRHVLDWMMFSDKHKKEIDWFMLNALIDEFGFRRFYDSFYRLGKFLLGDVLESDLSEVDKKMLADVWSPLDVHPTLHGVKGKLLEVGSTIRAWWKYHYFADISMLHDLWIQVKGFLFIKHPILN